MGIPSIVTHNSVVKRYFRKRDPNGRLSVRRRQGRKDAENVPCGDRGCQSLRGPLVWKMMIGERKRSERRGRDSTGRG